MEQIVLIIFTAFINILFITRLKSRENIIPIIIHSWWFFWLLISAFSITGLYIPKTNTYAIFMVMLSSVTIGNFIYHFFYRRRYKTITANFHENYNIQYIQFLKGHKQFKNFSKIIYYFVIPFVIFYFYKWILLVNQNPAILSSGYRFYFFEIDILFQNKYVTLIYNVFINSFSMVFLFLGTAIYILYGRKKILLISCILLSIQSMLSFGRFNFYYIIFCLTIGTIFRNKYFISNLIFKVLKLKSTIFISVTFLFLIILTTIIRQNQNFDTLFQTIFNKSIIEYHTLGFSLFDAHLNNASSPLGSEMTYGRASLGNLEALPTIVLRKLFGENNEILQSVPSEIALYLNTPEILGYSQDKSPLTYNAFGTILYTLYIDGGLFFIILMSIVYGFFLLKFSYFSIKYPTVYSISVLICLAYIGFFGIFQPILIGNWLIYLIIIRWASFQPRHWSARR